MERKTAHYRRLIQIFAYLILHIKESFSFKATFQKKHRAPVYMLRTGYGDGQKMTHSPAICLLVMYTKQVRTPACGITLERIDEKNLMVSDTILPFLLP